MEGKVFIPRVAKPENHAAMAASPLIQRGWGSVMISGETYVVFQGTDCTTGDGVVKRCVLPIATQAALSLLFN